MYVRAVLVGKTLASAALAASLLLVSAGCGGASHRSRGGPGVELTLQALPDIGRTSISAADLDHAAEILRARLKVLGRNATVTVRPGSNVLLVRIDTTRTTPVRAEEIRILTTVAQLWFYDFESDLAPPSIDANGNPVASTSLYSLLKQVQSNKGTPESYYLFNNKHSVDRRGTAPTLTQLLKPFGGTVPKTAEVLEVPAHRIVVSCPAVDGCLGATSASVRGNYYYLMKFYPDGTGPNGTTIPQMTGADLVLSGTRADVGTIGNPVVLLTFTSHGSQVFQKITKEEARRGQRLYDAAGRRGDYRNYAQHFAIVLDQVVETTPYIDFKQNPTGIPGPNAEIDLLPGDSLQKAKNLALVLATGALPFRFRLISKRAVH